MVGDAIRSGNLESPVGKKDKVTVLITVEAIIAGFMIAYGALNTQRLVLYVLRWPIRADRDFCMCRSLAVAENAA